jgi:hypothetical protein
MAGQMDGLKVTTRNGRHVAPVYVVLTEEQAANNGPVTVIESVHVDYHEACEARRRLRIDRTKQSPDLVWRDDDPGVIHRTAEGVGGWEIDIRVEAHSLYGKET